MKIEVGNIYERMEFDIIPVCGTGDADVKQFFELLEDDDILDIKGYQFDLVDDDDILDIKGYQFDLVDDDA